MYPRYNQIVAIKKKKKFTKGTVGFEKVITSWQTLKTGGTNVSHMLRKMPGGFLKGHIAFEGMLAANGSRGQVTYTGSAGWCAVWMDAKKTPQTRRRQQPGQGRSPAVLRGHCGGTTWGAATQQN